VTLLLGERFIYRVRRSKKTDWPWMEALLLFEVTTSCSATQHHVSEDRFLVQKSLWRYRLCVAQMRLCTTQH
jgi:hypothetical protein